MSDLDFLFDYLFDNAVFMADIHSSTERKFNRLVAKGLLHEYDACFGKIYYNLTDEAKEKLKGNI